MCLAKAYTNREMIEPILENISHMDLDGKSIRMETMFGEERVIQGKVLEVDFENSKIIVKPFNKSDSGGSTRRKRQREHK
ncbi:MAG: CooT family nickel-binding protein [Deltaproteobacteria bacterium]|nr:CooT family nickel-binding protein [Deltaproteobacteria bacterium]MBW2334968.1 CooT family nickel-binding protein [Deltaproteobacteria bacterium]